MLSLALIAMMMVAAPAGTSDTNIVLGTWEGESKCTVPNSPCHNEHVIYEFKRDGDTKLSLDGYKVVNGEKQFMGTLSCKLPQNQELSCTIPNARFINEWLFKIDGKRMTGTLYMDKKRTVFRRISVAKK